MPRALSKDDHKTLGRESRQLAFFFNDPRVHFMRNALAHAGKSGRRVVSAFLDDAEPDVLAYMGFPKSHRAKIHSANPIERLIREIKRRTEVVGIFPHEDVVRRLVDVVLLKQNNEWAVQRARYMSLKTMASVSHDPIVSLPILAA